MFNRLTLALLAMSFLPLPSCASYEKVEKALGTVATRIDQADKKITELSAAFEAKAEAAKAELAAKGAPVEGTVADIWEWAKQNPLKAAGSPTALILFILSLILKGRVKDAALKATVDAVEGLSPTAAAEFKSLAASSPHMTADAQALVAKFKAR